LFGLLSLRAAGALCALCAKPDFFLTAAFKKYCAACIRHGVLAKPSPLKTHACCPVNPLKTVELFYLHPPVRRWRN